MNAKKRKKEKTAPTTTSIQSPLNFAIDLTIRLELMLLFVWLQCRLSNSLEAKIKSRNDANEMKMKENKRISSENHSKYFVTPKKVNEFKTN